MNNWTKVDQNNRPAHRVPCIVWGVLQGDSAPDSHEGFYDKGLEWLSVRHNWIDERPNMSITNVTHFRPMPGNPEEEGETVEVPRELTAENGAKAALMGEFSITSIQPCPECSGDDCEDCLGKGFYDYQAPVDWTTIKAIYKAAIEHFEGKEKGWK